MIRLGLIGCGTWGWRYIPSAIEAGNCQVTHAAGTVPITKDGSWLTVDRVPSRCWRELLAEPIDAFIVATPPESHEEIARTLLEAGRPVMLEKPMALNLGGALRMMMAAQKSGAPLLINHQHLFAPAYEELRAVVGGWRDLAVLSSGGANGPQRLYSPLWDYGPHDVAMYLGLGTEDIRVLNARREGGYYRIALGTKRGIGVLRCWNDGGPKTRSFAASGDGGLMVYDDLDAEGARLRHNGAPVAIPDEKPLARSLRAFAEAVRTGNAGDWRMRPDFGVEVTRVLAMAEERALSRPE